MKRRHQILCGSLLTLFVVGALIGIVIGATELQTYRDHLNQSFQARQGLAASRATTAGFPDRLDSRSAFWPRATALMFCSAYTHDVTIAEVVQNLGPADETEPTPTGPLLEYYCVLGNQRTVIFVTGHKDGTVEDIGFTYDDWSKYPSAATQP